MDKSSNCEGVGRKGGIKRPDFTRSNESRAQDEKIDDVERKAKLWKWDGEIGTCEDAKRSAGQVAFSRRDQALGMVSQS